MYYLAHSYYKLVSLFLEHSQWQDLDAFSSLYLSQEMESSECLCSANSFLFIPSKTQVQGMAPPTFSVDFHAFINWISMITHRNTGD